MLAVVVVAATSAAAVVAASGAGRPPRPNIGVEAVGVAMPSGRSRPPWRPELLLVALAPATAVVVGLVPVLLCAVAAIAGRWEMARRARRRRDRSIDVAVPELLDLLVIAASAGHPVGRCLELVTPRAPLVLGPALEGVRSRVERGEPLTVALGRLADGIGVLGPALSRALVAAITTGAPAAPALASLAATARARRKRQAEVAARRLPVTLLFPLVCCVLPAFALLAVVPLLAASLHSLSS